MKKFLAFAVLLTLGVSGAEDQWEIKNMPALYENPGILKVVPGEVQALTFYFIAPKSVLYSKNVGVTDAEAATGGRYELKSKPTHNMSVDITLPEGMEFVTSVAGDQPVEKHDWKIDGRRVVDNYICDMVMLQPQGRMSEWKTWKLAVKVSEKAPAGPETLTLAVSHEGKPAVTKTWKIERVAPINPAPRLKHLRIGFWDYGHYMLEKAHPGLMKLFRDSGVNCFFNMLKVDDLDGFELYGSLHHSNFSNYDRYPTFDPKGNKRRMQLDGWYLSEKNPDRKPLRELLPDITRRQLEHAAALRCGWTGMDYEPTGVEEGFIPESIECFKKLYNVSDTEFEKMRKGLIRENFTYRYNSRRGEKAIFDKWNDWQSKLSAEFIKALVEDLKKADPKLKFHNTVLDALPAPDVKGSGIGIDASLEAKYLDMIEPQLYIRAEEVGAKYAIIRAAEWVKRVRSLNPNCVVHPLLVVRYAGGPQRNSPERLRQQTIGVCAEGAGGASYYFTQGFNANDWGELAETVRQLAAVEDFYVKGTRCDDEFKISGAPERTEYLAQWPAGHRKVDNPDWHLTAHKLGKETLATLFNLGGKPLTVKLATGRSFVRIVNGKHNADGSFTVEPGKIAYLYFQ